MQTAKEPRGKITVLTKLIHYVFTPMEGEGDGLDPVKLA